MDSVDFVVLILMIFNDTDFSIFLHLNINIFKYYIYFL